MKVYGLGETVFYISATRWHKHTFSATEICVTFQY